ncbi:MAG: CpsB/CapC family capsule biosynthesis tyrosine phosphatase [Bacilli bacterium]
MKNSRIGSTMFDINNQILQLRTEEAHDELRRLVDLGYTDVILTYPVLEDGTYEIDDIIAKFNMYKVSFKDLNLYLGNEVHYHYSIIHRLKNKDVLTLNQSNYVIIKLPLDKKPALLNSMFKALSDYVIILSNVDEYKYFNFKDYIELKKQGIKFLVKIGNLRRRGIKLLKHEMIDFLVTYDNIKTINSKLKKKINIGYYKKINIDNYKDIVNFDL